MLVRDVSADVWAESLCGLPSDQHPYAACRRISAGSSEVTIGLEGLARSVVARHPRRHGPLAIFLSRLKEESINMAEQYQQLG